MGEPKEEKSRAQQNPRTEEEKEGEQLAHTKVRTPRLSKGPQTPRSHDSPIKRKRRSSLKFLFTHFLSQQTFTEQLLFATDCFRCLRYSSEQRISSLLSSPEPVIW